MRVTLTDLNHLSNRKKLPIGGWVAADEAITNRLSEEFTMIH